MQLTLQDLALAVNFIDAAISRGAFKGNEIFNLGQLREKLATVVIQAQKVEEDAKQKDEDFRMAGE